MNTDNTPKRKVRVIFTTETSKVKLCAIVEVPASILDESDDGDPGKAEQLHTMLEAEVELALGMQMKTHRITDLEPALTSPSIDVGSQLDFLRRAISEINQFPLESRDAGELLSLIGIQKIYQNPGTEYPNIFIPKHFELDPKVQFAATKVLKYKNYIAGITGNTDHETILNFNTHLKHWIAIYETLRKLEITRGLWDTPLNFDIDYPEQREISLCPLSELS